MIIYIIYYQDIGEKRMKRVLVLSDSRETVIFHGEIQRDLLISTAIRYSCAMDIHTE